MEEKYRLLRIKDFPIDSVPDWPCPHCQRGILVGNKDSFRAIQSLESKREQRRLELNDPPCADYGHFTGIVRCNLSACKEPVFVTGRYVVDDDYREEGDDCFSITLPLLTPVVAQPIIILSRLHHEVPLAVRQAFDNCFTQFWLDNNACGNKLRVVVELLMDEQKIPAMKTLHPRIEKFKKDVATHLGEMIEAVKWIGNLGSHKGQDLSREDIVLAMQMIDLVTRKLYETESDKYEKLLHLKSMAINKEKGAIHVKNPLTPPPPANLEASS